MSALLLDVAARLLRHPAAPYHEHAVRQEALAFCAEQGLATRLDAFGNLFVEWRGVRSTRPLVLAAHLDHPGFEILRGRGPGRWLARFRGGVPDDYFRPGIPLRLMPGAAPARLGDWVDRKKRQLEIRAAKVPAEPPEFAVWELEDFRLDHGRLQARACDDLVGVAAVLATLARLRAQRVRAHVIGVLSRAEEVGFHGALALASARALPPKALVISLETSRELPAVKMGEGVIIRVGDRASIFNSEATRFLGEVAEELKAKSKDQAFRYQRALMGGGTCEATAYQEFGWQSAAVCVALGNYHNCGPAKRIRAEYVSVKDVDSMVDLLCAAARGLTRYERYVGRLPRRLQKLLREARSRLPKSA
jgi:endoglucanase